MKLNQLKCRQCGKKSISYACSKGVGATCFYFCNDPSCGVLITAGPASSLSGWEGGNNDDFKNEEMNEKIEEINKNTEQIKKELKGFDKDTQDEIFEMAKGIKKEKQSAGGKKNSILAKIKKNKSIVKNKTKVILEQLSCSLCINRGINQRPAGRIVPKAYSGITGRLGVVGTSAQTQYVCEICNSLISIGPAFSFSGGSKRTKRTKRINNRKKTFKKKT